VYLARELRPQVFRPYGIVSAAMELSITIDDIFVVTPLKRVDHGGSFQRHTAVKPLKAHGVTADFYREPCLFGRKVGVLRGITFPILLAPGQTGAMHSGNHLGRCRRHRKQSPTYGRQSALELSAQNWKQLWVPPGFAHGYIS